MGACEGRRGPTPCWPYTLYLLAAQKHDACGAVTVQQRVWALATIAQHVPAHDKCPRFCCGLKTVCHQWTPVDNMLLLEISYTIESL